MATNQSRGNINFGHDPPHLLFLSCTKTTLQATSIIVTGQISLGLFEPQDQIQIVDVTKVIDLRRLVELTHFMINHIRSW